MLGCRIRSETASAIAASPALPAGDSHSHAAQAEHFMALLVTEPPAERKLSLMYHHPPRRPIPLHLPVSLPYFEKSQFGLKRPVQRETVTGILTNINVPSGTQPSLKFQTQQGLLFR